MSTTLNSKIVCRHAAELLFYLDGEMSGLKHNGLNFDGINIKTSPKAFRGKGLLQSGDKISFGNINFTKKPGVPVSNQ